MLALILAGIVAQSSVLIKVVLDDDGARITADVLRAIVDEAHLAHRKVAAHATTKIALQTAIDGAWTRSSMATEPPTNSCVRCARKACSST